MADARRFSWWFAFPGARHLAGRDSGRRRRWQGGLHLYDLGPDRGFKLVGIERPDEVKDPP